MNQLIIFRKETIFKKEAKITNIKNNSLNILKNTMDLKNMENIRNEELKHLQKVINQLK